MKKSEVKQLIQFILEQLGALAGDVTLDQITTKKSKDERVAQIKQAATLIVCDKLNHPRSSIASFFDCTENYVYPVLKKARAHYEDASEPNFKQIVDTVLSKVVEKYGSLQAAGIDVEESPSAPSSAPVATNPNSVSAGEVHQVQSLLLYSLLNLGDNVQVSDLATAFGISAAEVESGICSAVVSLRSSKQNIPQVLARLREKFALQKK